MGQSSLKINQSEVSYKATKTQQTDTLQQDTNTHINRHHAKV